jgi:hypothetical protein
MRGSCCVTGDRLHNRDQINDGYTDRACGMRGVKMSTEFDNLEDFDVAEHISKNRFGGYGLDQSGSEWGLVSIS